MRALAAGDAAVLLDLSDSGDRDSAARTAAQLAAAISAAKLPGVLDVIPGACTVLVTTEPGSWDTRDLAARLLDIVAADRSGDPLPSAQAAAEIDVCYDGPDLDEVAALTGLPVSEVITRHQDAEYRVGWLGFAPGFGYLTGLDPALGRVPRLDTPRVAVPAGSVAIAGGLAAVYPAKSPGGWRLLGRTNAKMWDQERAQPALLAPGMRVRFRAVDELPVVASEGLSAAATSPGRRAEVRPPDTAFTRAAEVLQPGPLTTVQDLGRPGLGHLGVPASGAADAASLRLANTLVGNAAGAAGLEVTFGRLTLRFDAAAVVAVTGAPVPLRLTRPGGARQELSPGAAFLVSAGSVLRLGSPPKGLRSYVGVDGGFEAAPVLGSRSTDLLSRLGPEPLRIGDILALGARPAATTPTVTEDGDTLAVADVQAAFDRDIELTAIAGPRQDWFTADALEAFATRSYVVAAASNRSGLRLSGPLLERREVAELPSEGTATGSLQVAHDGQPILLLADHPTTGGYPVIAVVQSADIGRAAQLRPGQQVRFGLIFPD